MRLLIVEDDADECKVYQKIVDSVSMLIDDEKEYNLMSRANNPYGDGKASMRIADALRKF